jgi:hypothetical protein
MLLRRAASPVPLAPVVELRELLHDAEEGLLGFDAVSPIKPFLGEGFRALTRRLEQAVFLRYGLPAWTPAEHRSTSAPTAWPPPAKPCTWRLVGTGSAHDAEDPAAVLAEDPLAAVYGCAPWEPWPPGLAAERFLDALEHLQRRIDEGDAA